MSITDQIRALQLPQLVALDHALASAIAAGKAAEKRGAAATFAVDFDEDGASITLTVCARGAK